MLVFLGTLLGAHQGVAGRLGLDVTLQRLKQASVVALGIFGIALASLALDATWLIAAGGHNFYEWCVALFFVQVGALLVGAGWMTLGVLLRG